MTASASRLAVHSSIIIGSFNSTTIKNRVETLRQHLNSLGARQNVKKIGDFAFHVSYKRKAPLEDVASTLDATPTKVAQRDTATNPEVRLAYISPNNSANSFAPSKRSLYQRVRTA